MIDAGRAPAIGILFLFAAALAPVLAPAQARAADASSTATRAAAPDPNAPDPNAKDKLDVSGLEKRYWAAKDADFSVVQNRTYSKVNKFGLTAQYGYFVNDNYNDTGEYRLGLNYYWSERYGVELNYNSFDAQNSPSTSAFINQYGGVMPNHNQPKNYYGASFNWIPIYAKMSLLNSRIIYFDMAFSPGVGMTSLQQQVQGAYPTATAPTLSFDISQHFFLSRWFALRFDFQNRWYQDPIRDFRTGANVSNDLNHASILMGGFQFFY